jgi:hypothetical protein
MIVGNQEMMQLRFGQCRLPIVCGILGPIGVDGPQAGLWRQAAARPRSKQPRTGTIRRFCADRLFAFH